VNKDVEKELPIKDPKSSGKMNRKMPKRGVVIEVKDILSTEKDVEQETPARRTRSARRKGKVEESKEPRTQAKGVKILVNERVEEIPIRPKVVPNRTQKNTNKKTLDIVSEPVAPRRLRRRH